MRLRSYNGIFSPFAATKLRIASPSFWWDTPRVKVLGPRVLPAFMILTLLAALQTPAAAGVPSSWQIRMVSTKSHLLPETVKSYTAQCPAGETPISGGYTINGNDFRDVRRLAESVGFGSGASYHVDLWNASSTGPGVSPVIDAHVRCTDLSNLPGGSNVSGVFEVGANHHASGTVNCPAGNYALSASISTAAGGETLMTSSPTSDFSGWTARSWHDVVGKQMVITAHCIPTSVIPGVRMYNHSDPVGWGTPATASCPVGFFLIAGGTQHLGGDGGAISVGSSPSPPTSERTFGWSSVTESFSSGTMLTTVACAPWGIPRADFTMSAPVPNPNSTSVRWEFDLVDPSAEGGYTVSASCRLTHWRPSEPATTLWGPTACSSPVQRDELPEGFHSLNVTVTTSDGRSNDTPSLVVVDTSPPVVAYGDPPDSVYASHEVKVPATAEDKYTSVAGLQCQVDAASPEPCQILNGVITLQDVADGSHELRVEATDARSNSATYDFPFRVDTTPPTVSVTAPDKRFTVGSATTARWQGMDAVAGIASYEVRWQKAAYNAGFDEWTSPLTLPSSRTSHRFGSLVPGHTYCYSARGTDQAGNASEWSKSRCTAVPVDDRDLARSSGWKPRRVKSYFDGTALVTTKRGATLALSGVILRRAAVVATTCRTCGKVGVYVAGRLVGRLSLTSSKSKRTTLLLPAFSPRKGTVTLKVLSRQKKVEIDALGVSPR